MISTNRPAHLTSSQLATEIGSLSGDSEISDAAALTIASWWQSPGSVGRVLAQLSTTGSCDATELLDDIYATRREADAGLPLDAADARLLDLLSTWAINHPTR